VCIARRLATAETHIATQTSIRDHGIPLRPRLQDMALYAICKQAM
jgi:hypothetical protein